MKRRRLPKASTAACAFVVKPPRDRPSASAVASVFLAGYALMSPHCRRIDHHPLQVWLLQRIKDAFPNAVLCSSVVALEDGVPVARVLRQVAPWGTSARDPEHGAPKEAIVGGGATGIGRLAGKRWLDALLMVVSK